MAQFDVMISFFLLFNLLLVLYVYYYYNLKEISPYYLNNSILKILKGLYSKLKRTNKNLLFLTKKILTYISTKFFNFFRKNKNLSSFFLLICDAPYFWPLGFQGPASSAIKDILVLNKHSILIVVSILLLGFNLVIFIVLMKKHGQINSQKTIEKTQNCQREGTEKCHFYGDESCCSFRLDKKYGKGGSKVRYFSEARNYSKAYFSMVYSRDPRIFSGLKASKRSINSEQYNFLTSERLLSNFSQTFLNIAGIPVSHYWVESFFKPFNRVTSTHPVIQTVHYCTKCADKAQIKKGLEKKLKRSHNYTSYEHLMKIKESNKKFK